MTLLNFDANFDTGDYTEINAIECVAGDTHQFHIVGPGKSYTTPVHPAFTYTSYTETHPGDYTTYGGGTVRCLYQCAYSDLSKRFTAGDEAYIAFAVKFPASQNTNGVPGGNLIWELHDEASMYNSPVGESPAPYGIHFHNPTEGGDPTKQALCFRYAGGLFTTGSGYEVWHPNVYIPGLSQTAFPMDVWINFIVHIKFSEATDGVVDVWMVVGDNPTAGNFVEASPVLHWTGKTSSYSTTYNVHNQHLFQEFGLYSGSATVNRTDVVYHTGTRIRSTFADARAALTSGAPIPVSTVAPVNTGTPAAGGGLSCSTGTWANSPTSYTYQWQSSLHGVNVWSSIVGATGNTITLDSSTNGKDVRCLVQAINANGSAFAASNLLIQSAPGAGTVLGYPTVGAATALSGANFLDLDGPYTLSGHSTVAALKAYLRGYVNQTTKARMVIYADSAGAPHTFVAATQEVQLTIGQAAGWVVFNFASPVDLPAADYWIGFWYADSYLTINTDTSTGSERYVADTYSSTASPMATYTGGATADSRYSAYGDLTPVVTAPTNTVAPAIAGDVVEGSTVTTSDGTWANSPTSYTYQWQSSAHGAGSWSNVTGSTTNAFFCDATLTGDDIRCQVTATNGGGSLAAYSNVVLQAAPPAAPVPPPPAPVILQPRMGPMTFGSLQQELLSLRFAQDKLTSIKSWINHAYAVVWGMEDWTFRKATAAVTVTSGSATVTNLPADFVVANALYNDTQDRVVDLSVSGYYNIHDGVTTGPPEWYTVLNGAILVDPISDTTSSAYTLLYEKRATALVNDSDVPALPAEFHYMLVPGALSLGLALSNDFTFQFMAGAWQEAIQGLRRSYLADVRGEPHAWAADMVS